jgi:hypothetical protein
VKALSSSPSTGKEGRKEGKKISDTKRAGGVAQGLGPEFKSWYCKK